MPLNEENSIDYAYNNEPLCPFCDYSMDINASELFQLYEDGDHELNCPNCAKLVKVQSNVTFDFSTDEQDD